MLRQTLGLRTAALSLLIGLGALWTTGAQAAGGLTIGQPYFGVKTGLMMPDVAGWGDALNIGALVGAPVARLPQGTISAEGEFTTTLSKGDVNYFGVTGNWDVTTLAGYGVFRTHGPIYLKAKAGLLYENVGASVSGFSATGSDTGLSFGIGGGMRLQGGQSLEVEYTIIESNINLLSVGYNF